MRLFWKGGPESHLFPQPWSRGQLRNFFPLHSEDLETGVLGTAGSRKKKHLTSSATVETRCFGGGLRRHDGERPIHAPSRECWHWPQRHNALVEDERVLSQRRGGPGQDGHDGRSWEGSIDAYGTLCSTETDRLSRADPFLSCFWGQHPGPPWCPVVSPWPGPP